jgi:hypothetical protein|tara:strand:+ start:226 stop:420 length:195 start_codon:yes stop_codon:yes gene_type:complete
MVATELLVDDIINKNTLAFTAIYGLVIVGFSLYQLYLNWKQSKVDNKMEDLIKIMKKVEKNTRK